MVLGGGMSVHRMYITCLLAPSHSQLYRSTLEYTQTVSPERLDHMVPPICGEKARGNASETPLHLFTYFHYKVRVDNRLC